MIFPTLPGSVLILSDQYPPQPGGLARSTQRFARHARALGAEITVLVTRGEGAPGALLPGDDNEIPVYRLGLLRDPVDARQRTVQVAQWLHSERSFDLIHGQYASTSGYLTVYLARLLRAASYVSIRGNDLDRDVHDALKFGHLHWALSNADGVGAVSQALKSQAEFLADRVDIRYIPNSVDPTLFIPGPPDPALREALGMPDGQVLGFTGELRAKKGVEFLLDSLVECNRDRPTNLLILGAIRPEAQPLLEGFSVAEPHLADRICIAPYQHDLAHCARYYRLMDLFLAPSLWEGMPNSVLEAMACGLPVVASDAGGIPDLLEHGETGWMMSRHQLHEFGASVREILSMEAGRRAAVGRAAREFVVDRHSPQRELEALREAYVDALLASRQIRL